MANFYFCSECGNVFESMRKASVNCCGQEWQALEVTQDPNEKHKLDVSVENGKRIFRMHHPQTKEHYFTFIAYVCKDEVVMRTYHADEEVVFEIPEEKKGEIYWHCNLHGMYRMEI